MPPRRKSSITPKSEPKLFRCTGYGDCDMVFTRAEHLARHARKHTGEKPFRCVVPGCFRMFSRFDNMMQHSQTHNRTGKRKPLPKASSASTKKRRSSATAGGTADFENSDDDEEGMKKGRSYSIHPDYYRRSPSPTSSMMMSRTLPLPRSMSLSHGYYPPALSKSPSLPDSPEEPWRPFRDVPPQRRRLSAADLKAPIHSLHEQQPPLHPCAPPVVDITSDEYEALQGFGKFSSKVETNSSSREKEQVELPAIQPNLSSQVAAFRQKVMPTQESFQRPLRGHAI